MSKSLLQYTQNRYDTIPSIRYKVSCHFFTLTDMISTSPCDYQSTKDFLINKKLETNW